MGIAVHTEMENVPYGYREGTVGAGFWSGGVRRGGQRRLSALMGEGDGDREKRRRYHFLRFVCFSFGSGFFFFFIRAGLRQGKGS